MSCIPYSSAMWLESIVWRYKNFSQSEETRKLANIVFDTIKAECLNINPTQFCALEEILTFSDGALRYRLFQIEKKLEDGVNQHTAQTLIAEKYSIEYALLRR